MGAILKVVETDGGGSSDGPRYARATEERFAWLKSVRKKKLSASALKFSMLLFDSCNSLTGQCNPSHATIMRECQMTNPSRAISELRKKGLIDVQTSPHRSNQYFLILRDDRHPEGASELSTQGDETDNPGDQNCIPGVSDLSTKPVINLEPEPEKEPESEPSSSAEALWQGHKPSQKDIDFAAENGIDNKRLAIEWPSFLQYNIDHHMTFERQYSKWMAWIKNLLLREHEKATGETPKTRAEARRRDIKNLLAKGDSESSKLSEILKPGPSQILDKYRKKPKES